MNRWKPKKQHIALEKTEDKREKTKLFSAQSDNSYLVLIINTLNRHFGPINSYQEWHDVFNKMISKTYNKSKILFWEEAAFSELTLLHQ